MTKIVFLGKETGNPWTLCITLPKGADFYAAIEMTKRIANIPEMLSVEFYIDFNRFDFIGPFPGEHVEKDYDAWILISPTLWLSVWYTNKEVYKHLRKIFEEYKDAFPNIDIQSGI